MSKKSFRPRKLLTPVWSNDLTSATPAVDWLWHGYIAPRNITLLASQWKSGKTTLLSALLAKMKAGGELAGRPVRAGRALVVTEEGLEQWRRRGDLFDFGNHVCWLSRPFSTEPNMRQWIELIVQFVFLHVQHKLDLIVIDPLSCVLPGRDENNAGSMRAALMPLSMLIEKGPAVLLLHHTRKNSPKDGGAARGSGALPGAVDILMEMHFYRSAVDADRRRRLQAWSRFEETPRQLIIERTESGTDYKSCGDLMTAAYAEHWAVLADIFSRATQKLSRLEVLREWPEDPPKPDAVTLWTWLEQAVREGRLKRSGTGRRGDSYRYWQPGREQAWWDDPLGMPPVPEIEGMDGG